MSDDERTRRRLSDATKSRIDNLASGWDTPEPEPTPEPDAAAPARPRKKTLPPPPPGSQARKQLEEAILDAVETPRPVIEKPALNRGLEDLFGAESELPATPVLQRPGVPKPSLPPPTRPEPPQRSVPSPNDSDVFALDEAPARPSDTDVFALDDSAEVPKVSLPPLVIAPSKPRGGPPTGPNLDALFGAEDSVEAPKPVLAPLIIEATKPRGGPPSGPNIDALFADDSVIISSKTPSPASPASSASQPARAAGPAARADAGPAPGANPAAGRTAPSVRFDPEDSGIFIDPSAHLPVASRESDEEVKFSDTPVPAKPKSIKDRLTGLNPLAKKSDDFASEAPSRTLKDRLAALNPLAKKSDAKPKEQTPRPDPVTPAPGKREPELLKKAGDFTSEAPSKSFKERKAELDAIEAGLTKKSSEKKAELAANLSKPGGKAKPAGDDFASEAPSKSFKDRMAELDALDSGGAKSRARPGDDFASEAPSKSFKDRMAELDALDSGGVKSGAPRARPPSDDFASEAPSKSFKERMAELDALESGPAKSKARAPNDDFASESPSRTYRERMAELDALGGSKRSGGVAVPESNPPSAPRSSDQAASGAVSRSNPASARSNDPVSGAVLLPRSNPPSAPRSNDPAASSGAVSLRSNPPGSRSNDPASGAISVPRSNPANDPATSSGSVSLPKSNPPSLPPPRSTSLPPPRSNPPSAPPASGPIGIGVARAKPTTVPPPPPRGKPTSAPPPVPPRSRAASVPPPIPRANAPFGAKAGPTETGTVELHGAIAPRTPGRGDETDFTGPPQTVVPVPLGEFEIGSSTELEQQKLRSAYEQSTQQGDAAAALLGISKTKVKAPPIGVLLGETAHKLKRGDPGSLPETVPFERGDPTSLGGDPTLAFVDPETATGGSLRAGAALRRKRGLGGDVQYVLTVVFGVRKARSELTALEHRQTLRQEARKRALVTLGRVAATVENLDHPALGRAREGLMAAEDERGVQTAAVAAADSELARVRKNRDGTAKENADAIIALDKELADLAAKLEPLEKQVAGIAKRAADLKDQLRKLDNKIAATERDQQTAKPEAKMALAADLATLKADRTAVSRDEPKLAAELDTLSPAIAELEAKRAEAKTKRAEIEADEATDKRRADDLMAAIGTKRKVVERAAADAELLRDKILFELGERLYVDRPNDLSAELRPIDAIDVEIGTGDRRVMELKEILASVDKAKLARGIGVLVAAVALITFVVLLATGAI